MFKFRFLFNEEKGKDKEEGVKWPTSLIFILKSGEPL